MSEIVQLYNNDGITKAYPKTLASEVYLDDGTTKIMDKFNEVNSQLDTIEKKQSNNKIVNVKDFGAKGDGVTDDTISIQNAINYIKTLGGTLYFPRGKYLITSNLIFNGLNKCLTVLGDSRESILVWNGSSNCVIFDFTSISNDELKISFENLKCINNNNSSNLTLFKSDTLETTFLVNISFYKNYFSNINIIVDIYKETDQLIFEDNYVLGYTTAIKTNNGVCSNIHILNNHFRGGKKGSIAFDYQGGANVTFINNTVQSASDGIYAVKLNSANTFKIENTYFESGVSSPFNSYPFYISNSSNGNISNNSTHGNADIIITLDTCTGVTIGDNKHNISGGYPNKFLKVVNSLNVKVNGLLSGWTTRVIEMIDGNVDYLIDKVHNGTYFNHIFVPTSSELSYANVGATLSSVIFSKHLESGYTGSYFFIVKNDTEGYYSIGYLLNQNIIVELANNSNGNMVISTNSENKIQVTNKLGAIRTIKWSFLRLQ